MKTLKFLLTLTAIVFVFVPLIFTSAYIFSGCSKAALITVLQAIPEQNFWVYGVTVAVVCMYTVVSLFITLLPVKTVPEKAKVPEKRIFRLEDDDIPEQLKGIDISDDKIIATVSKLLNRYDRDPDICNCDGRDMPVYKEDGKYWCPQCGYEVL